MEGLFSTKSDVYSFGVLVLEIISGRKNTGFYKTDSLHLLGHVRNNIYSSSTFPSLFLTHYTFHCVRNKKMCLECVVAGMGSVDFRQGCGAGGW